MVDDPEMSLMLTFSTHYQTSTPTVMDAMCNEIHNNTQHNCTAELVIDVTSVEIIRSIVSGPYGSNSIIMETEQSMHYELYIL